MWTLNSSRRSPSNTVRPMPTMPGRNSSTGKFRFWPTSVVARQTKQHQGHDAFHTRHLKAEDTGKPLKPQESGRAVGGPRRLTGHGPCGTLDGSS